MAMRTPMLIPTESTSTRIITMTITAITITPPPIRMEPSPCRLWSRSA